LKEALHESSFVFLIMRVGKKEMRVLDERIPLSFGLIGQETVGAGGAAMAVRTVPKILEVARLIQEECPQAWVINFTNPSGMVTEALLNHSPLERVVGICDGPSSIKAVLSRFLEVPEEEIFLDYFGLNHLGWVKGIFVRGEDYLPKMMKYLPMFPVMEKLVQFPVDFLLKLRMLPNPYLRYYYFPEKVLEEMCREPKTRGEKVKEMNEALFTALKEGKRKPLEVYKDYIGRREFQYGEIKGKFNLEEGEGYIKVALELLRGLSGFQVGTPVVNLRNRSAILGMEETDVVEVPVHLLRGLVRPVASGPFPRSAWS
jgi:6-phospho-beta-glucosidase